MKCQNCAKQYYCNMFNTVHSCSNFKSWIETKNYGEVKRIENTYDIKETEKRSTY